MARKDDKVYRIFGIINFDFGKGESRDGNTFPVRA